jgi:anti-sigma regulatory factor (Ser/Thr protein kinase)
MPAEILQPRPASRGLRDRPVCAAGRELHLDLPAVLSSVDMACERVQALLEDLGMEKLGFAAGIVARECLNNAVLHGSCGRIGGRVKFAVEVGPKWLRMHIGDEGPGFDWRRAMRQGAAPNTAVSGRGIWVVCFYARRVAFNRRGNKVTVWVDTTKKKKERG